MRKYIFLSGPVDILFRAFKFLLKKVLVSCIQKNYKLICKKEKSICNIIKTMLKGTLIYLPYKVRNRI